MQIVFSPQGNSLASSAAGSSDSVVSFVKVGILSDFILDDTSMRSVDSRGGCPHMVFLIADS
jgi:hypothetical protein